MESIQVNNDTLYRTPFGWWSAEICKKAKPYWGCVVDNTSVRIKTNTTLYAPKGAKDKESSSPISANVNYEYMNFKIALMRAEMSLSKNPYKTKIEDYIDEAVRLGKIYRDTDITGIEYADYNEMMESVIGGYKEWYSRNYKVV